MYRLALSTVVIVGFGLFRAMSSSLYSSAFGSASENFGFIANLEFVFFFNAATLVMSCVIIVLVKKGVIGSRSISQLPALAVLAALFILSLTNVFPVDQYPLALILMSVSSGFAMALLWATWLEIFVMQQDALTVMYQVIGGFVLSCALSVGTTLLSLNADALVALIELCVSGALYIWIKRRLAAPVESTKIEKPEDRLSLFKIFISFFVLVGVVGILHTTLINSPSEIVLGVTPSWVSTLASTVLVVIVGVFMGEKLKPIGVYKACFPIMIIILSLLPFFADALGSTSGVIMLTCYKICNMVFIMFIVYESRRMQVSIYMLESYYMAGSSLFLLIGLGIGLGLNAISAAFELSLITLLAFAAIYPLIIVLIVLLRHGKNASLPRSEVYEKDGDEIDSEPESAMAGNPKKKVAQSVDSLAAEYGLTKREKEILGYLSRGRSARFIAETLVISENTVWFHIKKIYSKIGLHTKQELLSRIEKENPLNP